MPLKGSFVQIANKWARDNRLTHKARGILVELMTHTEGWDMTIDRLASLGPEGRDAISGGVRELVAAGYLERVMDRTQGRFKNVIYRLVDPWPAPGNDDSVSGKTVHGNPATKNTIHKNTILEEPNPHRDWGRHATARQIQMLRDNYAAEYDGEPPESVLEHWGELTVEEASQEIKETKSEFFHKRHLGELDPSVPGVSDAYLLAAGA